MLGLSSADLKVVGAATRIAQCPAGSPFRYVVTPNANQLVRLSRDLRLRTIYRNAALCLLDPRVVAVFAHWPDLPARLPLPAMRPAPGFA